MDKQKILKLSQGIEAFDDINNNIIAFADGPINVDSYCKSTFPIVFVLQEPYTDEKKYLEYLSQKRPRPNTAEDKMYYSSMSSWAEEEGYQNGYYTYLPIVSMVNQIFEEDNTYKICRDERAYSIFKNNVAILNVKKVPNTKVATSGRYTEWAKNENNIKYMSSQIKVYKPKLVVMANISRHMKSVKESGNDCCIWDSTISSEHNFLTKKGNRVYYDHYTLYIDTIHFTRLSNVRKNEIIQMAIAWKNGNKDMLKLFKEE